MKLPEWVNITVHYTTGVWVGRTINNPKFRFGALITTLSFLFYQLLGVLSKGDKGYPETKEFMMGNAAALASHRVENLIDDKNTVLKVGAAVAVIAVGAGICYWMTKSRGLV